MVILSQNTEDIYFQDKLTPQLTYHIQNQKLDLYQEYNIMEEKSFSEKFDIIISNPPYLTKNEVSTIGENVKFEPKIALFAPSDDPLLFYKKIINFSMINLNNGGLIYFEINPIYIKEIKQILAKNNLNDVNFRDDFRGNKRFLKIVLNERN